jgi:hypothetical protein
MSPKASILPPFRVCSHSREGFVFEHPRDWHKTLQPYYVIFPDDAKRVPAPGMIMYSPAVTVTIGTIPREEEFSGYFDNVIRGLPTAFSGFRRLRSQRRLRLCSADDALEYCFEFGVGPDVWVAVVVLARRGCRAWNLDGSCLASDFRDYAPTLCRTVRSLSLVDTPPNTVSRPMTTIICDAPSAYDLGSIGEQRMKLAAQRVSNSMTKRFPLTVKDRTMHIDPEVGRIGLTLTTATVPRGTEYNAILQYCGDQLTCEKTLQSYVDEVVGLARSVRLEPGDEFSASPAARDALRRIGEAVFEQFGDEGLEHVSCNLAVVWPVSQLHASLGDVWTGIGGWTTAVAWAEDERACQPFE